MTQRFRGCRRVLVLAVLATAGCASADQRLQQHADKLQSCAATALDVGQAWLAGHVSGTYAKTTLEQTFLLLEKERAALSGSPEDLRDSRGARLSQAAERLARLLATMMHDVSASDSESLRSHLSRVPVIVSEIR